MKFGSSAAIVVVALAAGLGGGHDLWPRINASAPPPMAGEEPQPTDAEATAAVRRHKDFFGTYANAEVKLGDCSANHDGPGTVWMTALTMDATKPKAQPVKRPMGFARLNGQWEVSIR